MWTWILKNLKILFGLTMSKKAKRIDLELLQGSEFDKTFQWVDEVGNAVTFSGMEAECQFRKGQSKASKLIITLSTENNRIILGGSSGTIRLLLDSFDTASIVEDFAFYDIELFPTGERDKTFRLVQGIVDINKEVTKGPDTNLFNIDTVNLGEIFEKLVDRGIVEVTDFISMTESFTLSSSAETEPPTISDSSLTISDKTDTTATISFVKATDNQTPQSELVYELYMGVFDDGVSDFSTISSMKDQGTLKSSATDVSELVGAGLSKGVEYLFNILVRDNAGNESIYTSGLVIPQESTVSSVNIDQDFDYADQADNTAQLTASVIADSGVDTSVTWSSDNDQIATVDQNGLVTFVSTRQVTIRAKSNFDNSKFDELTFNIYEIIAPSEEWEFTTA